MKGGGITLRRADRAFGARKQRHFGYVGSLVAKVPLQIRRGGSRFPLARLVVMVRNSNIAI